MAKPVVGLQLYSLRDFETTVDDLARTAEKVAKIGYKTVQVSGIKLDAKDIDRIMKDNGLQIVSAHDPWDRFLNDLDGIISDYQMWGAKHLAIGGVPGEYRSLDGLKKFIDELGAMGEKIKAAGMDFSYHNHSQELAHYEGRTWLEQLYEAGDPDVLKAEIDTYWIAAGGGDPAQWVARYPGRQPLLHCKDMIVLPDREQRFAPVGEGNLNWKRILDTAEEVGVEYLLVEQDRVYDDEDVFEEVAKSYNNLKAMGYE